MLKLVTLDLFFLKLLNCFICSKIRGFQVKSW